MARSVESSPDYVAPPPPINPTPHDPAEPAEVAVPEDHPVRHAMALNAILDILEGAPAFAGWHAKIGRIRAALNYVPPKA
jgi:hypothetical protein